MSLTVAISKVQYEFDSFHLEGSVWVWQLPSQRFSMSVTVAISKVQYVFDSCHLEGSVWVCGRRARTRAARWALEPQHFLKYISKFFNSNKIEFELYFVNYILITFNRRSGYITTYFPSLSCFVDLEAPRVEGALSGLRVARAGTLAADSVTFLAPSTIHSCLNDQVINRTRVFSFY